MKNTYISPDVLTQLYYFIANYYNDHTLADYILNIFSINKENIVSSNIPYEKFYRILHYIQKMSGDQLFCYNAGRYFSEARLLKSLSISGIRFSPGRTIRKINKILKDIFPAFEISVKHKAKASLDLLIHSSDNSAKPNFFFAEYIKGIISHIPKNWDLPLAEVKVESYPFGIEEILKDVDIPYRKDESSYLIFDDEIAKEERDPDNIQESIQVVKNDLFIKDIFIKKNTKLNSKYLSLKLKWNNFNYLKISAFAALFLAGIASYILLLLNTMDLFLNLTGLFVLYELLILLVYSYYKNRSLRRIYNESEANLLAELSAQRGTTSEAIQDTVKRLQSIENVIEITKEIIYDKNIVNLFENIRKLSAKALNADRTTVFLHDKEKKELRSGPELSEEKQEFSISEDKGIVGEVVKLKKIVNVKDAYNNPLFNKAIDRQTGYETKTILSAPLLDLEKNFLGVIQVLNKKDGVFEKIDEHIIETLSTYIASALKDTLTISSLQKRGIDPDMLNGLSSITQHIFSEYNIIQETLTQTENPAVVALRSRMQDMSVLLEKLAFLFNEQYSPDPSDIPAGAVLESVASFIKNNKGNINIDYEEKNSLSPSLKLILDKDLLNKTVSEILTNSIEAIDKEGRIILRAFNYVIIPNELIHDLSLEKIIAGYNAYSEENIAGFIKFVNARKPFLESDLIKIKNSMREFAAFEFFDSGSMVDPVLKEKIFHPFFSTKNRFGLGLAIAKKAITLMDGTIEGPIPREGGKSMRIFIPIVRDDKDIL